MTKAGSAPVVLLAFANDPEDRLKNLRRERENVEIALRPADVRQSVKVLKAEQTSTEYLFGLFRDYADAVAIFHYGGHANGAALRLESADGAAETAHVGGLAQLFGMQKGLQLVFLNGCATKGQVQLLLASGVKAVIATAVPIDDLMATEFAEQFYLELARYQTIGRAFDAASAFVRARYDLQTTRGNFRSFDAVEDEVTSNELAWGLYVADDAGETLEWALPDPPGGRVLVRNAPPVPEDGPELSTKLIDATMAAIAPYNPMIQFALDENDKRERPKLLSDAYPSPIGEQLRRVFASRAIGITRLRLLVLTYEVIAKLACFTALSQLWNARLARPDLVITDEQWAGLNSFMTLTAETQPTFDYLKLTVAIVDILAANNVEPFMVEAKGLKEELTDAPTTLARHFMDEMRVELFNNRVPDHELSSFCAQAEQHLAVVLADFAFIVRYKFTSIKNIGVDKKRNRDPITRMKTVRLDKISSMLPDEEGEITSYIDVNSVVLQKKRDDLADYLNLTPFLIDENAIIGADSSKLFFYDYSDDAGIAHYASVNDNVRDRLKISDEKYPEIKQLCKEFRDSVFRK